MSERNPFIVLEADVAFYASDAAGNPMGEVYLGGCVERLLIEDSFKGRIVQTPGDPFGREYHEDEDHSIEIDNLWLWNGDDPAAPVMPRIGRNQRLFLVAVWFDEDTRAWAKRTWFGVTAQSQKIPGDGTQGLRFRAERFVEEAGLGARPTLLVADHGTVLYRNGAESTPLYRYDYDAHTFTPTDESLLDGRAEITIASGLAEITVAGQTALAADAASTRIKTLTATGGSFVSGTGPRLEFYVGSARIATLTAAGELAVPNVIEQSSNPDLADDFQFGSWLFSLAAGRAIAPEFEELDVL